MTGLTTDRAAAGVDLDALEEVQRRVLWLAVRMVDLANHERDTGDGVKVGGHQASSASLVSVMTALYLAHLGPHDRVAVKPHASPVFHAIEYLLGNLDRSALPTLRAAGGLQAYPSRTKDPDRAYVDFSTGSVGLGAAAPLFAAVTRRYVDAHFGPRPPARFVALLGDAELDEGNIWEAVADPATAGLGDVLWVVDLNRQSLDRVVPGVRIDQFTRQFEAAGWHVAAVKYGRRLSAAFERPHGAALRAWIDGMPNEHYQSLFALHGSALRDRFLQGAPPEVTAAVADVADDDLGPLVTDLGGHDLASLLDAFAACDAVTDRPSVVFAYTVKGWGLPIAGNPRNHSALMTTAQVDAMRAALGLDAATELDRLDPTTPAGALCAARGELLRRRPPDRPTPPAVPARIDPRPATRPTSTQEAFGRLLTDLSRDPGLAPLLVTTAPDVATSTNLAGVINRLGVFSPADVPDWAEPDALLKWAQTPRGQHIELGISEMNLFLLLGQLGLADDLSSQPLVPVGTVYDPFVCRGLDAFIHALYSGSRFIVAGTPSGVTLAPEGGAHQSTVTAGLGLQLPGVVCCEPAYAGALDWQLADAVARVLDPGDDDGATYFRLTTRPLDQAPFEAARTRIGDDALRAAVLAGGYRLLEAPDPDRPAVQLAASGAVLPEVIAAAAELADEGVAARVVDVCSLDRLYRGWQAAVRGGLREGRVPGRPAVLAALFAPGVPLVTVHDAASSTMAWLGSAAGCPTVALGVDTFGQSGSVAELYELHGLSAPAITTAALAASELGAA
ncbi:MAG TPA: pyruvate dehydrogenase [Acidimicrobiales bacterium]|nr:pyruvate dehydrogenase [Acidimicrobiales bacterium]